MKKTIKTLKVLLYFFLVMSFFQITEVKASGDFNGEGDSGNITSMCSGTTNNICWDVYGDNGRDDGIRISLIDISNNNYFVKKIDYSNRDHNNWYYLTINGELDSKIEYYWEDKLKLMSGYANKVPGRKLPNIMRGNNPNQNMENVKSYFSEMNALKGIANDFSIPYEELISGKYKLLLEPIIYVHIRINGKVENVAMTPTQMALYDEQTNRSFYNLSTGAKDILYSTFAKAMYLSKDDLGFTAKAPTAATYQANDYIVNYLGLATVSFKPEAVEDDGIIEGDGNISSNYRYNTQVFSSYNLSSTTDRTKDNPVNYTMVGSQSGTICSSTTEVPANQKQVIWCKWTTPNKSTGIKNEVITVKADGVTIGTINVTYSTYEGLTPPDTNADDKKPTGWKIEKVSVSESDSNSFSKWYSVKQTDGKYVTSLATHTGLGWNFSLKTCKYYDEIYDTVYEYNDKKDPTKITGSHDVFVGYSYRAGSDTQVVENNESKYKFYKIGSYENVGSSGYPATGTERCQTTNYEAKASNVKFIDVYTATMSSSTKVSHDTNNPTANGEFFKSGYGLSLKTKNDLSIIRTSTGGYGGSGLTISSLMTTAQTGIASYPEFSYKKYYDVLDGTVDMQLRKNSASVTKNRVHFTPIWYPDNKNYTIKVDVMDVWTPAGMLKTVTEDSKTVKGNMWDDRHIGKN